jgi:hypothetical protein
MMRAIKAACRTIVVLPRCSADTPNSSRPSAPSPASGQN